MRIIRFQKAAVILLVIMLASCSGKAQAPIAASKPAPENIERIVSMAPSVTETLIHLGLGSKIVAVDAFSIGLPGLPENLPVYDIMSPDTESIAVLKPDVVFATGMSQADRDDPYKPITSLGTLVVYIPSSGSIAAIKEDIRLIGRVTGTGSNAESIIKEMEKKISDIVTKIGSNHNKKKVYFEIGAEPTLYSFGKGAFLNEMLEMLGTENILAGQDSWVSVSEETVIDKNPDVIFSNVKNKGVHIDEILARKNWSSVAAIKNKAVYFIDYNTSSRPNEYIVSAMLEMAKALYPELFKQA